MDPYLKLIAASREEYSTPSYYWENRGRNGGSQWVFQRTLSGRAFLETHDGDRRDVMEGEMMVFHHGDGSAYGYPLEFRGVYELSFIAMEGELADSICAQIFRYGGDVCSIEGLGETVRLFDEILERFENRRFRDRLEMAELLYRFLLAVSREKNGVGRLRDPVAYCYNAIEMRHVNPITVAELADELGMSREHLARSFKERYGESPGNHLRRLRLERGRAMLLGSSLDVETVSLSCGYAASDSFGRAFKREYGVSPREFRSQSGGAG
ncbi:helix-turn-helix domain-containing protein [Pelagicoccus mobilis]|uniref:Helix-turn-helix transcriptional regulator n=1 Tax=Pelagicoccus mobilis TaxID=415221 RepID=A0A934RXA7_9BACT|nr:AraC family transcriptional regulator [Pelagicoccus mobilis]MBK1878492.1 helix-turn-helix transcriptional regulator [Pelagicoccus mobilis]